MQSVAVLGLGQVGALAAALLAETGVTVTGYDLKVPDAPSKMVVGGTLRNRGFLKQEDIGFAPYLATRNGARYNAATN